MAISPVVTIKNGRTQLTTKDIPNNFLQGDTVKYMNTLKLLASEDKSTGSSQNHTHTHKRNYYMVLISQINFPLLTSVVC